MAFGEATTHLPEHGPYLAPTSIAPTSSVNGVVADVLNLEQRQILSGFRCPTHAAYVA
jgi:hypothetical protein